MTYALKPHRKVAQAARLILEGAPYAPLPLPQQTKARVQNAVAGLIQFDRHMPPELQEQWQLHLVRNPARDEPDDGILRRSNGKESDQKLMLHVRQDLVRRFTEHGVLLHQPWYAWIRDAVVLRNSLCGVMLKLARAIDAECPELRTHERMREAANSTNTAVLRINLYDEGAHGYAKPHVDRNAFTISAGQSSPDLYFVDNGKERLCDPLPKGSGIVFPAAVFERVSNGRVKASVHGTRKPQAQTRRWSVVFFATMTT